MVASEVADAEISFAVHGADDRSAGPPLAGSGAHRFYVGTAARQSRRRCWASCPS